MAVLRRDGQDLVLELTVGEKVWGLHGDVRVPMSAVRRVTVADKPLAAVRGLRAPGLAVPGRTKIGTWRRRGGKSFAVVRSGRPAVRVALAGAPFEELLVSVDEPERVARELRGGRR
ncbi:hypothetical protein [Pseudonocardia asaccharolytica]|uniref:Bacterial Pleckstrin homology domain-containing protein n=1 Tax=Pseudonocardia asaccharolytica DSM 44247 = NBRC 16224 TaxID=1123024 RepID=A0A511CW67_9PSEU|nr:hypothetical protein [Pseudonocardia asaccharolytica]GEL16791.1 hypothetical protein PA7_06280 [Pseudonocardia asaccharolytica DSM 44247 = NBRC 16224]